jgi:hypothetical protein
MKTENRKCFRGLPWVCIRLIRLTKHTGLVSSRSCFIRLHHFLLACVSFNKTHFPSLFLHHPPPPRRSNKLEDKTNYVMTGCVYKLIRAYEEILEFLFNIRFYYGER